MGMMFVGSGIVRAQAAQSGEAKRKVPSASVEEQFLIAIDLFTQGKHEAAHNTLRAMYGRKDVEPELVLRAETAMAAARAADRIHIWEGSDFGRATPWGTGIDRWQSAGDDGPTQTLQPEFPSPEYFEVIISHSLRRIRYVTKASEPEQKVEHINAYRKSKATHAKKSEADRTQKRE